MRTHPMSVQRVVAADGDVRASLTVYCTREEKTIDFAACEACDRFERVDCEYGASPIVTCRAPTSAFEHADLGRRIARAMTRDVLCVAPDVPLRTVAELLIERSIGALPVIDASGAAVGLVSKTDVLRALLEGRSA